MEVQWTDLVKAGIRKERKRILGIISTKRKEYEPLASTNVTADQIVATLDTLTIWIDEA